MINVCSGGGERGKTKLILLWLMVENLHGTLCSDILLNVFLAIAVDNLADAESLNTDDGDKKE